MYGAMQFLNIGEKIFENILELELRIEELIRIRQGKN